MQLHGGLIRITFYLSVYLHFLKGPCDLLQPNEGTLCTMGVPCAKVTCQGHRLRSQGSRPNKGPKQRQVGSHQCQVASLIKSHLIYLRYTAIGRLPHSNDPNLLAFDESGNLFLTYNHGDACVTPGGNEERKTIIVFTCDRTALVCIPYILLSTTFNIRNFCTISKNPS